MSGNYNRMASASDPHFQQRYTLRDHLEYFYENIHTKTLGAGVVGSNKVYIRLPVPDDVIT